MQPHEQRVVTERDELQSKLSKLNDFMRGDVFGNLPEPDRILLTVQQGQMFSYLQTLQMRIERFT
jgi:hypothetical protein